MTSAPGLVLAAAGGPSPLWYATRATGEVSMVLLTATVALGVAGTARFTAPRWPRVVTAGLHRNLSLLAVAFVAAHVLTTVLDSYARIGLSTAVVPFSSGYRPLWLSLGTIAFDLLLAVIITSLLRDRLGYRTWQAVHWLAYASWPVALWHSLGTGTDSRLPFLLGLDALCVAAVAAAIWWRLGVGAGTRRSVPALAMTAGVGLATILFVVIGPLQPGWARRAGTPPVLLGGTAAAVRGPGLSRPARRAAAGLVLARVPFRGQAVHRAGPGAGDITITVRARTTGSRPRRLNIVLFGAADGQGVILSGGTVRIGPGGPGGLSGPVVALSGQQLVADLRGRAGTAERADIALAVSGSTATGQISLRPAAPS